jgi:hypothetical protein
MRLFLLSIFTVFIIHQTIAQSILSGVIMGQDEKPIQGVTIKELGRRNYTTSDYYGNFKLRITSAESDVIVSHPEYDSLELRLHVAQFHKIFLTLRIEGNPHNLHGNVGSHDFRHKLPDIEWEAVPYIFGEPDVNRKIQMLPGIEQGIDGFSNLHVRGGSNDQNLYLYNGIPIYNYNQLFGLTSIFSINGLENVEVDKGISSARFGGRLSSVIQLQPNRRQMFDGLTGSFDINILSAGLFLQNNIGKEGHFSLNARRSWIDLLIPVEIREDIINVVFYDINMNFATKVNKNKDLLEVSFINARTRLNVGFNLPPDTTFHSIDSISIRPPGRIGLGLKTFSTAGIVKLTQNYSRKFSGTYSAYGSYYRFSDETELIRNTNISINPPRISLETSNAILDIGINADYSYFNSNRSMWYFGIQNSIKSYNFGYYRSENSPDRTGRQPEVLEIGEKSLQPTVETALYAENRFRPTMNTIIDIGGRVVFFSGLGGEYLRIEPRVDYTNKIADRTFFKAAFNTHHQFVHLLNNGNVGGQLNLWVPSTENIKPSSSHILSAGIDHIINKKAAIQVVGYGKLMRNLLVASDIFGAIDPRGDWQSNVAAGSGRTAGIEFIFNYNSRYSKTFLSYTFSRAFRIFDELFVNEFLFAEDRPHMFKLTSSTEITDELFAGFVFMIGSGRLFTIPSGRYLDIDGNYVLETTSFNNYRSPFYSRLDFNINWERDYGIIKFGVYNVLANSNTVNVTPEFDQIRFANVRLIREYYFRFIPTAGYTLKF